MQKLFAFSFANYCDVKEFAFIGRSNVLEGKLIVEDGKCFVETKTGYRAEMVNVSDEYKNNREVFLSVRPEEFLISDKSVSGIKATVTSCVFLGLNTHYFVKLESGEDVIIIQESSIENTIAEGTEVNLVLNTEKLNVFDKESQKNILKGVQNDCADK